MGKNSNVMNRYFSDSRRFADLFNTVFFQGVPVVKEEELSEASEVYHQPEIEKPRVGCRGKLVERIHDVCKKLENGEILRILTLENQSQVDYTMPFRCMQYDTMEYGKQIDTLDAMTVLLKLPAVWKKQSDIMCINGDKEEYNMCQAVIEWEAEARSEGENIKLIKLICQKLRKGKTPEVIAEELEEPMESVEQICKVIFKCGLETDALEIYEHTQSSEAIM